MLLSLGVAEYSTNDYDAAETHWKKAAQVHPEGAEPWYNLGFCYLAKTPPDYDSAEAAWNKVIELDPESEMAQSVKQHLASLHDSEESPTPGR